MSDRDSIRKLQFRYSQCQGGDLHTGELMNMVCVDSSCQHRGLICPICRMETHETHYILPLKSFLQQVQTLFVHGSGESGDLNNLSDYLRNLQASRKQLLTIVRKQVNELANGFRRLEEEIETMYVAMRRNVLAQSSITTKLPALITLLTEEDAQDSAEVQKQFRKYCQLIKFENEKIRISDKAKLIVESYADIPNSIKNIIEKSTEEYLKRLQELPKIMEKKETDTKAPNVASKVTFSTTEKQQAIKLCSETIQLSQQNTHAELLDMASAYGFVFVNQSLQQAKKIILRVDAYKSYELCVGLGKVEQFKQFAFMEIDPQNKNCFQYIRSDGTTSSINKQISESDDYEPIPSAILFNEVGTVIELQYWAQNNTLKIVKRNTKQEFTLKLENNMATDKNFKFVVGIGYEDAVTLLKE